MIPNLPLTAPLPNVSAPTAPVEAGQQTALRRKAMELEAQFLSEMLRHAGAARALDNFGGGIGEEQMSSFLRDAQSLAIARRGGIGLAESLFDAMKGRAHASD